MSCGELSDLLYAFVDGELSVEQNVAILKHTELCPRCAAVVARERELRELTMRATQEPAPPELAARLVSQAAGRLEYEHEQLAPAASPGLRRWGWGLAAAALLALGLGLSAAWTCDLLCVRGCPTMRLAQAAVRAAEDEPRLSLTELQAAFPRPLFVPAACGITVEGGQLVSAAGAPPRPLLRLRCQRSGQQGMFVYVDEGHSHFWQRKTLPDGRVYLEAQTADGLHLVGWRAHGGVYVCLAQTEVREGALFALAAAVRDAAG